MEPEKHSMRKGGRGMLLCISINKLGRYNTILVAGHLINKYGPTSYELKVQN